MAEHDTNSDIIDIAAIWIARLDSGQLSAEQLIELRDWAKASPAHMRELERLADIWEGLDKLTALQPIMTQPKPARRRTLQYSAIAAGIAAFVAVAMLWPSKEAEFVAIEQAHVTEVGEQRSIEPGEGSTISLNTNSGVAVAYSAEQRLVRMTHGEAFFDVAPDDERPFVVEAELGTIVVTGTAFLVRIDGEVMEVVVEEGSVQLQDNDDDADTSAASVIGLGAGELARIEPGGRRFIEPVDPGILTRRLGWREGMLIFDGETLQEVVSEIGRYTSTRILIDDQALRERRIGGYFRLGETEDLLATLANDFDIEVTRVGENEVRLAAGRN